MAKTVDLLVEKSTSLVEGLNKHLINGGHGVTTDEIHQLQADIQALKAASAECDRLRAELAPKVQHMNQIMTQVKVVYAEKKRMLKLNYPQAQWANYGVPDKK